MSYRHLSGGKDPHSILRNFRLLDIFLLPENFDIRIKSNFKHEAIKRLSLPTDIRLPDEILAKFARDNPALASGGGGENLTRKNRRASLVRNIFLNEDYLMNGPQ